MKKLPGGEPWRDPLLGPCACSQLRRTSRSLSALYDEFLSSAGLTVTQYALLVSVARMDGIARTVLAAQLGMERTTLTRNLRPLEREALIGGKTGSDRREHVLHLTPKGRKRLDKAFTCWARAQEMFLADFGQSRFEELRKLLMTAAEVSASVKAPRSGKKT